MEEDEDAPAAVAEPEAPAAEPEPAPAPVEPARATRRLFRIEFDEASPDSPQEGVISRIPAATRAAEAAPAKKADATALKAALEALARETSE